MPVSTIFPRSIGLRLFPQDFSDPVHPLRRYLCIRPNRDVMPVPGPPILMGTFIPVIIGETPILLEPWEDVSGFLATIQEIWDYSISYDSNLEYDEDWFIPFTSRGHTLHFHPIYSMGESLYWGETLFF